MIGASENLQQLNEEQQPNEQLIKENNVAKEQMIIPDNEKAILLSETENKDIDNDKAVLDPPKNDKKEEPIVNLSKDNSFNKKYTMDNSSTMLNEKKYEELEKFLDSRFFQILVNIITVYALFADDFRTAFLPKSVDNGFDSITIFCMVVFTIEITLSVLTKEKYLFSFFFWLDVISTISLIFDLKWFQSAVLVNP